MLWFILDLSYCYLLLHNKYYKAHMAITPFGPSNP